MSRAGISEGGETKKGDSFTLSPCKMRYCRMNSPPKNFNVLPSIVAVPNVVTTGSPS